MINVNNKALQTKRVIVHADDLGLATSVTLASIHAMRMGNVSSGSVMVPCPGFAEVVEIGKADSSLDLGIHLTFTSEWPAARWRPVCERPRLSSIADASGFFWPTVQAFAANATDEDVKAESRAQIDLALSMGMRPSHLDSHMFALYRTPRHLEILMGLSDEYKIPVIHSAMSAITQTMSGQPRVGNAVDSVRYIGETTSPERWLAMYVLMLRGLPLGVHQLIVHCGFDNEDLRAVTKEELLYGAAWRQRDFNAVTNMAFGLALEQENISLASWSELQF